MTSEGSPPVPGPELHAVLAATVRLSHTLRNLLMIMGRCVDSIREAVPPRSPIDDDLGELDRTLDRAFHLTHQLLALGHPATPDRVVVDVNQLAANAEGMIARAVGGGVTVRLLLTATRPNVMADPYELEWLLLNLIMNSRETMTEGSLLTIETADHEQPYEDGRRAFVRVTIHGAGPAGVTGGSIHVDLPVAYGTGDRETS